MTSCAGEAASQPSSEITRSGFIPHVFVSGESLRDRSLSPSAVMIQKPFTIAELVWAIKRALAVTGTHPANPQA